MLELQRRPRLTRCAPALGPGTPSIDGGKNPKQPPAPARKRWGEGVRLMWLRFDLARPSSPRGEKPRIRSLMLVIHAPVWFGCCRRRSQLSNEYTMPSPTRPDGRDPENE